MDTLRFEFRVSSLLSSTWAPPPGNIIQFYVYIPLKASERIRKYFKKMKEYFNEIILIASK
jgi:hypothetical protein